MHWQTDTWYNIWVFYMWELSPKVIIYLHPWNKKRKNKNGENSFTFKISCLIVRATSFEQEPTIQNRNDLYLWKENQFLRLFTTLLFCISKAHDSSLAAISREGGSAAAAPSRMSKYSYSLWLKFIFNIKIGHVEVSWTNLNS